MKTEFLQSEKFPQSGMHNPLPKFGLKANLFIYFVNLPKTEPPRWRVFSFLIKSENTLSLTLQETLYCVNLKK